MSVRQPRTVAAATALLERHADLSSRVALVEADRNERIGAANSWADGAAQPMLEEIAAIKAAVAPWFAGAGQELLPKDRKSVQLGGCMIGTRASRAKLGHAFESDKLAVEALLASRYAKHTTKVSYSLDRAGTLKLLQVGGKTAATIAELGFTIVPGTDQFFIEPVEQSGSISA